MANFILFLAVAWLLSFLWRLKPPREAIMVIGHRGAKGLAPENTLLGLCVARDNGATWVEVDVQRSQDGRLILMHDVDLDRTTSGSGRVLDHTWDAIAPLRVKADESSIRQDASPHTQVPTLDAALQWCVTNQVPMLIEVKNPSIYPELIQELSQAIHQHNAQSHVHVLSFYFRWLRAFREYAPDIPIGSLWFWMPSARIVSGTALVSVYWWSIIIDPTLVWRARQSNVMVYAWTVNSLRLAQLLTWLGVTGLTTDRPDVISKLNERRSPQ